MPTRRLAPLRFAAGLIATSLALASASVAQGTRWTFVAPPTGAKPDPEAPPISAEAAIVTPTWDDKRRSEVTLAFQGTITAFRLEVLPDTPPQKGRRRNAPRWGIAELRAFVGNTQRFLPHVAIVDAAQPKGTAGRSYQALDGSYNTAWSGRNTVAMFRLDKPTAGTLLKLSIDCGRQPTFKRLRVAVTTEERPLRDLDAPLSHSWLKTQGRINNAIDKGVQALIAEQELDGSWRSSMPNYRTGQTALSLYALVKSGLDKDDIVIKRAEAFLLAHLPRKTYSAACHILALTAIDPKKHKKRVQEITNLLVKWQHSYGAWGYPSGQDFSNTHYAGLGLHIAKINGAKVPKKAWQRMRDGLFRYREATKKSKGGITGGARPVGFGYRPGADATGSMTSAGVVLVGICQLHLRGKDRKLERAREEGLAWLEKHFSMASNPYPKMSDRRRSPGGHIYYYLYAIERVGGILGIDKIGPFDWYRQGALRLVDIQAKDGHWQRSQSATSFALLFLTRATSRPAYTGLKLEQSARSGKNAKVGIRVVGSNPIGMWLDSWSKKMIKDHGQGSGKKRNVRVLQVEWMGLPPDASGPKSLAVVPGKGADQRFAHQHDFKIRGEWQVWAKATIDSSLKNEPTIIESGRVPIKVVRVEHPDLLDYASRAGANLLTGAKVKIEASTELGPQFLPKNAIDGLQAIPWISRDDDPLPALTINLDDDPIRADTLVLSHAYNAMRPDVGRARVRRVEVVFNESKKHRFEIEMKRSELFKTVFALPKRMPPIRKVEVHVRAVWPGDGKKTGVGFGEVELQMRKKKRRGRRR